MSPLDTGKIIPQGQRVLSERWLWQRGTKRLASTTTTEGCDDTGAGGGLTLSGRVC